MTDDQIADAVKNAVLPIMRSLRTQERRSELASFLLSLGWELTRGIEGNEFMRGWLDRASADLGTNPAKIVLVEHH
jgi:hypothetical protein